MTRGTPVFLDRLGLRAKAVNVGLALSCLALALAVLAVATGVLFAPNLPPLPSPAAAPLEDAASPLYGRRKEVAPVPTRNRQVPSGASGALRLAYLSLDHPASFASLRNNAVYLNGIIPNWLKFARENGRAVVRIDKRSEEVARWLRARAPHLAIYPQLSTALGASETVAAITNPASRASLVQQVLEHIAATGSHGVVVSLADLPSSSARGITAFIAELGAAVRGAGGKLLVAAMVGDGSNRLQELARLSDFIIAETHDRASTGDDDVAPAGQGWFEKEIWSALSVVPPQKLIARVGAYATDIDEYGTRRIRSVQTAWDIASKSGSRIVLDPASLNSFFVYRDEMKRQHKVWILDAVSGFNQTKSALAAGTAGVALSSLGLEDPGVWSFLQRGRVPDEAAIKALSDMEPGPGGFGEARGVLIAASPGLKGSRLLTPSTLLSLITQQEIRAIPGRDRAKTWPAVDPKALAITFDDGPDQEYTPKILDVLAEKNVRATFYILGRNAVASPEIMERMYREGHDIGNHSYSHANLFMAGADRIAVEFNATQRVMEAQLGVTSLLVRPPYAYDGYFYLDSSPDLVRTIHDLGYVVGGIDVDGFDYLASAELIRERVVTQILEGEGQVILLHDSGGNRRATIAALPRIIDDLRSAGYRFVTTHELAGLSRAQVMPPERGQGLVAGAEAGIRRAAIRIGNSLAEIWPSIAIGTAALGVLRFALIVLAALTRRTPKRTRPSTGPSAIAVIVPAYNEEAVIATTVRSLLGSSISERLEILVVDDGSKDRTAEVVREAFGHDARVRLLCQANGGKAAALNHGIASTQSEIIVAIDSDTALMPDAIELLVTPFADPGVGAVAGKVVVGNRRNLITRFQALEYTVSQSLDRRAFERFNAIGVVPGAIGAWRRSALVQVGGYSHDTLAEDADLTLSLQRAGWRIVSESRAVALTEAPESLKAFVKQRFRWTFGTLQVAWKHKRALVERPSGVSLVTLPNIFLFQFGFTVLAPFMDGLLLTSIAQSSIVPVFASAATQDDNLAVLALYWALFQIVDLMAVAAGVALDGDKSCWRLVPLVLIQRFSYRQVMYWIALRALLAAVKGTLVGWGKLVRTGNVAAPATAGT